MILSIYQPLAGSDDYDRELENMRSEIERIMHTHAGKKQLLIGGDFNAHIGRDRADSRHVIGIRYSNT